MTDLPEWNEEETRLAWNRATFPSAQTTFRMRILSSARSMVADVVAEMSPLARERDQGTIARIKRAETCGGDGGSGGRRQGPWWDRHQIYNTWYEPFDQPDQIQRAARFALSQDVTGLCTAAGVSILSSFLEACQRFTPLSGAEQEALIARAAEYEPLFA